MCTCIMNISVYLSIVLVGIWLEICCQGSVEEKDWEDDCKGDKEGDRENKLWCLIEVFDPGHAAV